MQRTDEPDHGRESSPEYAVPEDASPLLCDYCDAPFVDPDLRALHWGLEHPDRLTADQRAAFERAYADEQAAIRRFRLRALGLVVVLYFALVMTYAAVV